MASNPDNEARDELIRLLAAAKAGSLPERMQFLEAFRSFIQKIAGELIDSRLRAKVGESDLVQGSIVEAANCLPRFRGMTAEEFNNWLATLVRNNAADLYRKYGIRQPSLDAILENGSSLHPQAVTPDIPAKASMNELRDALDAAIAELKQDHREILQMRNKERLPFAQIAKQIGCTEDAARQRWCSAVEQLRVHPLMRPHLEDRVEESNAPSSE